MACLTRSQWVPCPALWWSPRRFWRSDPSSRSKSFPSPCQSRFITFSLHKPTQSVVCMITAKFYSYSKEIIWTSLVAQLIKNPPTNAGDSGQALSQEGLLEKGMATHSSVLAWRIPWREEPGGLQSMGSQTVKQNWVTNTFTFTSSLIPSNYKNVRSRETSFLAL